MEQSPCPPTPRIYYVKRPDHLPPWATDRSFGLFFGANFQYADFISSGGLGSIMYSISEYKFFVSSWCLSYRKSIWLDIALVGAPRWAGSKDSEFQSFKHGFFQKTFLPNSSRYFTGRWTNIFSHWTLASLHHTWSSADSQPTPSLYVDDFICYKSQNVNSVERQ